MPCLGPMPEDLSVMTWPTKFRAPVGIADGQRRVSTAPGCQRHCDCICRPRGISWSAWDSTGAYPRGPGSACGGCAAVCQCRGTRPPSPSESGVHRDSARGPCKLAERIRRRIEFKLPVTGSSSCSLIRKLPLSDNRRTEVQVEDEIRVRVMPVWYREWGY